jgi:hypothetical protein
MPAPLLGFAARIVVSSTGRGLAGALLRAALGGPSNSTQVLRKIDVATAMALTAAAKAGQAAAEAEIPRVFDRPVPFTKKAIGVRTATRSQLWSEVFVKRAQIKYLAPQIFGGARPQKRFEQRIDGRGGRLRVPGSVPSTAAALNNSGNIPKATLLRLLKESQQRGSRYFQVDRPGGPLAPGIWRKVGTKRVVPVLIYAKQSPQYGRRFRFHKVVGDAAGKTFPIAFNAALVRVFAS